MASKPALPVTGSPRGAGLVRTLGWAAQRPLGEPAASRWGAGSASLPSWSPTEAEDPPWCAGGSRRILLEPSFRPRLALNHPQLLWLLLCLLVWTCLPPYQPPRPPTTHTTTLCGRDLVVTGSRVCVLCPLDTQLSSCWPGPADFGGRGEGKPGWRYHGSLTGEGRELDICRGTATHLICSAALHRGDP